MSDETISFKFYHYDPTMGGAVAFAILFSITTLWHAIQLFRTKTWSFVPYVIGGILEAMGYIGRALSSKESPDWSLGPYMMQSICLLLAPALLAASIYMLLGRIILVLDAESHSLLSKKWLTKLFVTGDVLSFLLQGTGGGVQAMGTLDGMKLGDKIIVVGLVVQILFFGLFIVTAGFFDLKLKRYPIPRCRDPTVPWRRYLNVLYTTSGLIMVRSVFRLVEYVQGHSGYLLRHEAYLYVFDALLIFVAMVVFNWFHPSEITRLLERRQGREYELQGKDGV
ncbi:RTA1-domain-containing protein [Aspergillus karnatakaensis]|uniref:RTA1 domain-containing protein n=1 Tax=Aspergillus karnatakaensis TaxID=1810916 RepID=UPI003CCDD13D